MWNVIAGNRLLDKRRKQEAYRRHQRALRQIRSSIDNESPIQYAFLQSRPKAKLRQYQRDAEIQCNNDILIAKMMNSSSYIRPKTEAFVKESLHAIYRDKIQRQIDTGNQKLVQRLQSAKSHYRQSDLTRSMLNYYKYRNNIANSRVNPVYGFDPLRTDSTCSRSLRPDSAN